MATKVLNTAKVVLRMERITPEMERELEGELDVVAQLVARRQRQLAPKHRSLLATGVRVDKPAPLQRDIGPTAEYAGFQEEGVKPGGKGLPKFSDPEAVDIVAWLRDKAFQGRPNARRNSMKAVKANLELRDRYEGLAWHVRRRGVKATPFVGPSLQELDGEIHQRLQAAAERGLAKGSTSA